MRFSTLTELPTARQMVDVFGGYNHNLRISDSEFYDMKNMTSTHYPVLSPRGQRGVYDAGEYNGDASGIIVNGKLCFVAGPNFYIEEEPGKFTAADVELSTEESMIPKRLVKMGTNVIIFPDKKAVDLNAKKPFGVEIGEKVETEITAQLTIKVGDAFTPIDIQPTEGNRPPSYESGGLWLDNSYPKTVRQWSETESKWVEIPSYVTLSADGIGTHFEAGDAVTIYHYDSTSEDGPMGWSYQGVLGNNEIVYSEPDKIIVNGLFTNNESAKVRTFRIERYIPDLDYVVEHNNRLWGCKYGETLDSNGNTQFVNEIYASKLGDFKNWQYFAGTSIDSYTASIGIDGEFTGAVAHGGYPIFFKENCMIKVFGSMPSNFQIQTIQCDGVQEGCDGSVVSAKEILYYKSRNGICAYDGSTPIEISKNLGNEKYSDAVAGVYDGKYYISMKNVNGEYNIFVYDTANGLWHKEDNVRVDAFCPYKNDLLYIDHADKKIKTMLGSGIPDLTPVEWMAETGVLTTEMPDKKYISRLTIRMALAIGTRVHIYAEYDSSGAWEHLFTMTGNNLRSFAVPIRPKRCDHLRLKFEGEGDAKIYSVVKTIEQGSDY